MKFYTLIALSEFDVRFDDAMARRPFVARRHDVGYQHHHNEVNPPSGPGDSETPEPEPSDPPSPEPSGPSPAEIAEWQGRHDHDEPSQSLAESVWRATQAGREAEDRSRDNPAMARVEQSGVERQLRQEEIDNREANWRRDWQEWNRNPPAGSADSAELDRMLADFERYGGDWDDAVIDQWTTDDGHDVQLIDGDGDGKADVTRVLLADGTVQYRYDSDGDGKANRVVVMGNGILTVHTDSDGDGAFDTVEVRDAEGNVLSHTVHADTDGDGAVDQVTATTPEGVKVHTDSDGDGAFDTVEVRDAEGNVLSHTVHADTDGDGAVDQVTVTTPEGVTVHTDSDGDGAFDTVEVRDAEGNVLSRTVHADTDGDGAVDQVAMTTPEGVTLHTDSDGDGTFDQVEVKDADGNVLSHTVRADTDGDGTVDQVTVTTNALTHTVHDDGDGAVEQTTDTTLEGVTVHTDSDGDGSFDTIEVRDAEGNVLSHTGHADTDGDGAVDQATVTTPEGVTVHTDGDGDGAFDTVEVRDAEGNVLSHTVYSDTDGDGAVDQATVTTPEGFRVHTDNDGDGTFDIVPEAGSASDAVELFELNDSGSKPSGSLTREQGTGSWHNASLLENDSGINLVGASYSVLNENTIVADGTVSINGREARVRTTYTRNSDGTITMQSRLIDYYKDDAPGGGGGGGNSRAYTVAADGTVGYTENGHTYTVSDVDLRNAVIEASNTGDATGLSSVGTTTVTNSDGQVMAYSLSRTDAVNTVVAAAQGVFNPYQPTANNGTPHPESGQPVYFDGAGNAFYDVGLSNPVDDQAQMYFSGMLDTDRDGVPDSRDGVVGSMGNEFTVDVPDRFMPDAVPPAIPTVGDIQANAAALPAAAAARGIDTTGLFINEISQKVFIHDQTAFVEQFLGPDAVPDGQAPTREQLAQAQEMYDAATTFIGRETSGDNYGHLPGDPAEVAAPLADLSARADELSPEWQAGMPPWPPTRPPHGPPTFRPSRSAWRQPN